MDSNFEYYFPVLNDQNKERLLEGANLLFENKMVTDEEKHTCMLDSLNVMRDLFTKLEESDLVFFTQVNLGFDHLVMWANHTKEEGKSIKMAFKSSGLSMKFRSNYKTKETYLFSYPIDVTKREFSNLKDCISYESFSKYLGYRD